MTTSGRIGAPRVSAGSPARGFLARFHRALLPAAAALLLWAPSPAAAVTNGRADADSESVVAILEGGRLVCSGVAVAEDAVLTAAHCVQSVAYKSVLVAGKQGRRLLRIRERAVNPEFRPKEPETDYALVRTAEPLGVSPVPLAVAGAAVKPGQSLRVVGFGADGLSGGAPAGAAVERRWGAARVHSVAERSFFAGGESQPCIGDSGAPALLQTPDGRSTIIGICVSGSPRCTGGARFLRVDPLASFLRGHLGKRGALP